MFVARLRTLLVILCFAVGVSSALGQATTSIRGTTSDQSGALIPGVSVTLENIGTGATRTTLTGEVGGYLILQIQPGAYRLRAELTGFRTIVHENLQLLVDTPTTLDLQLEVGEITQTVEVTASATPILNTVDATLGNAFQEEQVLELPIESRNVAMLLSLQPGVTYMNDRDDEDMRDFRSGVVNGARSDQSTINMDGVDVTDQAGGQAFTSVLRTTPDSLQEFRVTTLNSPATSGNSSGAQMSLVTKGGTNEFHGSLYEYLRNTATSANDYFIKLAQLSSGAPNKPPKLNRNVYGGSVGGPFMRDRLFFFVNYEGRKDRREQSIVRTVATDSFKAGNILYLNDQGGITTVTAADLTAWDPLGIGPNAAVSELLRNQPTPNDQSTGDLLNSAGHRFAAPVGRDMNVYIGRLDFRIDAAGNHNLFMRGSGQKDLDTSAPYLPGETPQHVRADRSKGFALGYTSVLSPTLINEFRWGFTRRSIGNIGNSSEPFITLTGGWGMGLTRTNVAKQPINNFVNNVSWVKGRHTLEFGGGMLFIRDLRSDDSSSYSSVGMGITSVAGGGVANTGLAFDPLSHGFPMVARTASSSYDAALMTTMGILSSATAQYNYDKDGSVLPQGEPIVRQYAINQLDLFVQDTFQFRPNFTVNIGLRYMYETPPWETNGMEIVPDVKLSEWHANRGRNMLNGIPSNQDSVVSYVLGGKVNGGRPFYEPNKKNFSPRISLAWSPEGGDGWFGRLLGDRRTSIRAGASMVFDSLGTNIIENYGVNGSFGLSTRLRVPLGAQAVECAPRIEDFFVLPVHGCPNANDGFMLRPAPPGGFPQTPPVGYENGGYNSITALADNVKTPYSYTFNLSVARDLGRDMALEFSYVGRLSHRLLAQKDFAELIDIRDPTSGIFAREAWKRMSQLARENTPYTEITEQLVGPTAAFWNNLYPGIANASLNTGDGGKCSNPGTCTPIQGGYLLNERFLFDDTFGTWFVDVPDLICAADSPCSSLGHYVYYSPQFYSMRTGQSAAEANYHALQVSLRKRFSDGLSFDANYVWSKSHDESSIGTERRFGRIYAWDKSLTYAVSDFDMTHQFNANWVWGLPFGRGQAFGGDAPGWVNALTGGWQLSGMFRLTSGLPISIRNGQKWATSNINYATQTRPVETTTTKFADGTVNVFADPAAAHASFDFAYMGEAGGRNVLRGDGYLSLDASLSKRWNMPYDEGHSIQLRWEVFNVGNFTRFDFDPFSAGNLTRSNNFGNYGSLLTSPRVMQFGLRYEF